MIPRCLPRGLVDEEPALRGRVPLRYPAGGHAWGGVWVAEVELRGSAAAAVLVRLGLLAVGLLGLGLAVWLG